MGWGGGGGETILVSAVVIREEWNVRNGAKIRETCI